MQSYDAYLFDLDGTLVDTAPDINAALNFCLAKAQLATVDISLTRHWVGYGSRTLIDQALVHHQIEGADIDPLLTDFVTYYAHHLTDHSQIYPGVEPTLKQLKDRGAKLAVVTNKLTSLAEPLIAQIGLNSYFDLIVCGDTTPHAKPDPAPVNFALNNLGVSASNALFVGDSDTDVKAAKASHCAVVCLRNGYNHGTDVTTLAANGVIDDCRELL